jgi:hypothetical protein
MPKGARKLGFATYRDGALERIGEAYHLLRAEHFAGAIYLAGRAVEGMLRALIWRNDLHVQFGQTLETGHDLREMLKLVRNLGLLHESSTDERDQLEVQVVRVGRLWYNNLRFASSRLVETRWHEVGQHGRGGVYKTFKQAATAYCDDCRAIVKRCEVLCERRN